MGSRPETITEVFDAALAAGDPGRPALVAPSGRLSYEELDAAADAAAALLSGLGVGPGDRVAASLPNDVDVVVAFHGTVRLGAIWVGVNRALARPEKEMLLDAAAPRVLLADPATADEHAEGRTVVPVDPLDLESSWAAGLRAAAGAARPRPPDPDAPAGIAFTSGTTGDPKGIVHSHRNLLLPAAAIVAARGYDRTLRKGDCLPLTILNLQVLTTLLTASAGGCCILTDRRDALGVAEWIRREGVTVWNGVPALLYSMVHDPELDPGLLSGLAEVWTGGGPCPEDLFTGFEATFGVPLRQTYGLTEAPTVVTMEAPGADHVPEASGVPLPHLDVSIQGDSGERLPSGALGEIVVRGVDHGPWAGAYRPMTGLWREGRIESFRGPELRTGDIGQLDPAGNLFVRDRKKLLIIRGGANVYPAEVERVIEQLPGVRAAAVLGLPDDRLGQRVAAAVEVEAGAPVTAEGVIEHCRARLARYKVPDRVALGPELPRNAMGKVQRPALTGWFGTGP
jgi:long-chain acyl-CoA synthetase